MGSRTRCIVHRSRSGPDPIRSRSSPGPRSGPNITSRVCFKLPVAISILSCPVQTRSHRFFLPLPLRSQTVPNPAIDDDLYTSGAPSGPVRTSSRVLLTSAEREIVCHPQREGRVAVGKPLPSSILEEADLSRSIVSVLFSPPTVTGACGAWSDLPVCVFFAG